MTAYPDSFPTVEITSILTAVRSGSFSGQTAELAHNIWVVQGYGQRTLFGDPTHSLLKKESATDNSEDHILQVLQTAADNAKSGEATAQVSIPWNIVLPWLLKLAITVLEAA